MGAYAKISPPHLLFMSSENDCEGPVANDVFALILIVGHVNRPPRGLRCHHGGGAEAQEIPTSFLS